MGGSLFWLQSCNRLELFSTPRTALVPSRFKVRRYRSRGCRLRLFAPSEVGALSRLPLQPLPPKLRRRRPRRQKQHAPPTNKHPTRRQEDFSRPVPPKGFEKRV